MFPKKNASPSQAPPRTIATTAAAPRYRRMPVRVLLTGSESPRPKPGVSSIRGLADRPHRRPRSPGAAPDPRLQPPRATAKRDRGGVGEHRRPAQAAERPDPEPGRVGQGLRVA